jgi:large conductance mechanosensitive channel
MRRLLNDFRTFALSGNLIDLAVGLALGAAFATVVESLVANIILPLVAAIFGEPNFDGLSFAVGNGEIAYGKFLTAFVAFLLLAFVIMLLVKAVQRLTGMEAAGAQGNRECPHCKTFIPVDASVCMACTRDVTPEVAD